MGIVGSGPGPTAKPARRRRSRRRKMTLAQEKAHVQSIKARRAARQAPHTGKKIKKKVRTGV